ncbi:MAG: PilZ domain-containing protein [Candidatus Omnitrophica bacterium]|nr:PilZ domain-containing protein [Candidatus Omnitrophota bacterium]
MEKEKRKFKRFDAYMSVRYKAEDAQKVAGISLSKDLSREGLKITTTESIKEGTVLNLEIDIPDDPKPVYSKGEVMWSKRIEGDEKNFEQGVRFLMMDPVDKFRVLDYAYNSWLETKVNDFSDPEQIPEIGG